MRFEWLLKFMFQMCYGLTSTFLFFPFLSFFLLVKTVVGHYPYVFDKKDVVQSYACGQAPLGKIQLT